MAFIPKYFEWVSKNYFTLIGIIIIVVVVGWYYNNVEVRVVEEINSCNDHWREQLKEICPHAVENPYALSDTKLDMIWIKKLITIFMICLV